MMQRRLTERIWLRAFGTPLKFLAPLGTSDTLGTLDEISLHAKNGGEPNGNKKEIERIAKLRESYVGPTEENVKQKVIVPLLELLGHKRENLAQCLGVRPMLLTKW